MSASLAATQSAAHQTLNSHQLAVIQSLRRLPEFATIPEPELVPLIHSNRSKAIHSKQRILARLFEKLKIDSVQRLMETRKNERKIETASNVADSEKRVHEEVFNGVFSKFVVREIEKFGSTKTGRLSQSFMTIGTEYIRVLEIVLAEIHRSAAPSQPATASTPEAPAPISSLAPRRTNSLSTRNSAPSLSGRARDGMPEPLPAPGCGGPRTQGPTIKKTDSRGRLKKSHSVLSTDNSAPAHRPEMRDALKCQGDSGIELELASALNVNALIEKNRFLEAQVAEITRKNKQMEAELAQIHDLHQKTIQETVGGDYDRRRVLLLKSLVVQLQRELSTLKDTSQGREALLGSAANDIQSAVAVLSAVVGQVGKTESEKINESVRKLDGARKQLNRQLADHIDGPSKNRGDAFFEFISDFVIQKRHRDTCKASIADLCSGSIGHLNLRHVSRLEEKLHRLYKDLFAFQSTLQSSFLPNSVALFEDHVLGGYNDTMVSLRSAMNSLLSLSVLVPSAPVPTLEQVMRPGYPAIPTEDELLRQLTRCKSNELQETVHCLVKSIQVYTALHDSEKTVLENELAFHKHNYDKYNRVMTQIADSADQKKQALSVELRELREYLRALDLKLRSLAFKQDDVVGFLKDVESTLGYGLKKLAQLMQ
ncbi:uncharacterized protein BJ171DRAFT_495500 [Polychytrium aggregatum]|uniref:uncharacterized protein n=1 Tax=Polychytrium aggregatum TaxID=110093 RepID=UPI0022FDDBF1|nr:uncharacterized protein BJ171DRAFT_495500 [Polychytrium aggregatum]KAI9207045.1 hypothetical protein BJ171DRAFT_495500 [Polychytrium aggregatum]